jgi:putative endonuclease
MAAPLMKMEIMQKLWFLYMIECQDNSIYTGITRNVAERYMLHTTGKGARYTRSHPPKRLLATMEYPDQSTALKAEYAFKKLTAVKKREFISNLEAELLPTSGV